MKNFLRRAARLLPLGLAAGIMLAVPALAVETEETAEHAMLYSTWWALLPPCIAIVLALITKEAYSSLFLGVLVGAFLSVDFSPVETLDTLIGDGFLAAITSNAGIFMFLVLLGIIVALVNAAGGSAAFGRWAETHIKTRAGAQFATFILGILIFIDDYFNCLTVGSVMRPVTDRHRISRAKLAYLIDATAAPVCMIAPVSSWAAAVAGTAEQLDTGVNGIQLFIQAIPYNLYSLLTFVFIILLILLNMDYGPMRRYERAARKEGKLGGLDNPMDSVGNPNGRVMDLVIPVVGLIVVCTVGMLYVGGFFGANRWIDTSANQWKFIQAFGDTDAFVGLPWGSIIALVLVVAYLVARRVITFKDAMACIPKGFNAMVPPIMILTLAVSLKNMTNDRLGAALFVQGVMKGAAVNLYSALPAVIFLVACVLAFASGTSWGTFGILIPIVTAIFSDPPNPDLMIIGISACLAGAVCGDHCSPISDTTIMASAGAQVEHINHVTTQIPYAVTVAAVSFVGYIVAGFMQNLSMRENLMATWGVSAGLLAVLLVLMKIVTFFLDRHDDKRDKARSAASASDASADASASALTPASASTSSSADASASAPTPAESVSMGTDSASLSDSATVPITAASTVTKADSGSSFTPNWMMKKDEADEKAKKDKTDEDAKKDKADEKQEDKEDKPADQKAELSADSSADQPKD